MANRIPLVLKPDGTTEQLPAGDLLQASITGSSGGGVVGDALTTNPLSQFAATTSDQLRGVITDGNGTGALVFSTGNVATATLAANATHATTADSATTATTATTAGSATTATNATHATTADSATTAATATNAGHATTATTADSATTAGTAATATNAGHATTADSATTATTATSATTAGHATTADSATTAGAATTATNADTATFATTAGSATTATTAGHAATADSATTATTAATATTVTTNANLTGPITSVGNATTIADAELSALAGLVSAADTLPYFTGSGTAALSAFTSAGRALASGADATAQRNTLGLGNIVDAITLGTAATIRGTPTYVTFGNIAGTTYASVGSGTTLRRGVAVGNTGGIYWATGFSSGSTLNSATVNMALTAEAVGVLKLGDDAATVADQTIKACDGVGTDKAAAHITIASGRCTGAGTGGTVIVQTSAASTTSATPNALVTRLTISSIGLASTVPVKLPSYTVAGVPSAATAGAGAMIWVSNESGGACPACSDGTNWKKIALGATIS